MGAGRDGGGDRPDEDIPVPDMGQFMDHNVADDRFGELGQERVEDNMVFRIAATPAPFVFFEGDGSGKKLHVVAHGFQDWGNDCFACIPVKFFNMSRNHVCLIRVMLDRDSLFVLGDTDMFTAWIAFEKNRKFYPV